VFLQKRIAMYNGALERGLNLYLNLYHDLEIHWYLTKKYGNIRSKFKTKSNIAILGRRRMYQYRRGFNCGSPKSVDWQ